MFLCGRENVEDAATDRDFATPLHQIDPVVGDPDQLFHHAARVSAVTDPQRHRFQVAEPGDLRLQNGTDRRDHDRQRRQAGAVRVRQAAQHGKPEPDRIGPRGQPFVRQGLPAGEDRDRGRVDHARQRGGKILRFPVGRGQRQHRPAAPGGERGGGERPQGGRSRQVKPEVTDRGKRSGQGRISTRTAGQDVQQRGEGHRCVPSLSKNGAIYGRTRRREPGRRRRTGDLPQTPRDAGTRGVMPNLTRRAPRPAVRPGPCPQAAAAPGPRKPLPGPEVASRGYRVTTGAGTRGQPAGSSSG